MQRAFGKNVYKTVFLLTILTFGLVFVAYTAPAVALDEPELWVDGSLVVNPEVNVGDDDIAIVGTGAAPFARVEIYWDEIDDDYLLTTETADSAGDYETDEEDFEIPEDHAGVHFIIVFDDGQTLTNGTEITIVPHLKLSPDEGLPDDRIDVTGYGFGDEVEIDFLWFDADDEVPDEDDLPEDVLEGSPDTDENGTFTTRFTVPDVDDDEWPIDVVVRAVDEDANEGEDTFTVGQYIFCDPNEGYPTYGPIEWEARADPNEDFEVVFYDGDDLWISLANATSDDDGEMSGTFDVPYNSEPGDGPEPEWGNEYYVELWDDDDDYVTHDDFTVYPYPVIEPEVDGARANDTVEFDLGFFFRDDDEDTEVTLYLDDEELGTYDLDEYGNATNEDFEVPDWEFGHYELYAVDDEGYEAWEDFDIRPEGYGEMGTRDSVYFQGDHISFWVNTTDPVDDDELWLFVNITDSEGVLFWEPYCETLWYYNLWQVDQLIEGEYHDYYAMSYCELPWKMQLPHDVTVGTWNWTAYDVGYDGEGIDDSDDWDLWAEGEFEVVARLTLDLVLDRLDEMEATIVGLFSDTEGSLMAYIDTKAGTLTASLSDLNAKVVDIEGDTATLVTDLGMVKADVADIADEFPITIPAVDLTPMWAAVALSLVAAIAAIAAVVVVYQRIA